MTSHSTFRKRLNVQKSGYFKDHPSRKTPEPAPIQPDSPAAAPKRIPVEQVKSEALYDLYAIHDGRRAITLFARAIAHHAPELADWAKAQIIKRFPHDCPERREAIKLVKPPPEKPASGPMFTIVDKRGRPLAWQGKAFDNPLRFDAELARLALSLDLLPLWRIWAIIRLKTGNGCGSLMLPQLKKLLATQGVKYSRQHVRRLINDGMGLFWTLDRGRVYLTGAARLGERLTKRALDTDCVHLVETNRPGSWDMLVEEGALSGDIEQVAALVYAAWLVWRKHPTISRDTTSALFGRDKRTIIRWEQEHLGEMLTVKPNYAQCASDPISEADRDPSIPYRYQPISHEQIPPYAFPYIGTTIRPNKQGVELEQRLRWQLPNTYIVETTCVQSHTHRGQALKVRAASNVVLEQPPFLRAGGQRRSKMYFENAKKLRAVVKNPRVKSMPRYLFRGINRRGQAIWEWTRSGDPYTWANERIGPTTERLYMPKGTRTFTRERLKLYSQEKSDYMWQSSLSRKVAAFQDWVGPLEAYLEGRKKI
jgi:hypothetical protein